ncbi:N-carbamoyl-L-amino-acid hydrolase [Leucobacter luti]|uniref:M20 family metallo-hydrolase n=1 Tax=Leucobacter luti TaxID=340320 RepID=UPI00104B9F39|nr:M20 family metallo-hydrolase [Leucobacter luti]MCW2289775.1 N-carbamoyl-L-amino-acid hydrolase [Leucobacter luti]TCK34311.1 N-carbamoyl-L-amino-acid hydrolase [Leucobacter luti]
MTTALPADATAFLTDFHAVAEIGATPNAGVDRQAATPEDRETREWFRTYAESRGWEVRVDGIGNQFALLNLTSNAPYVLLGSHLDSQPLGGRFDGAYGVIAGLHAADRIARRVSSGAAPHAPTYNLAVVNWFNEEGGRFAPSIMGSSVFAGIMDEAEMREVRDLRGISVREALESIGYLGTDERPDIASYAEIHIEQGRILEREGIPIGAVDASWHTQKLDIEVLGEQSHTGATLMSDRHDALLGAAKVIQRVHEVTDLFPPETLVSSVGQLTLEPNSPIVVARRVHLVADLRADDREVVRSARDKILSDIREIEAEHGLVINARDFDVRANQFYPEAGLQLTEQVADALGTGARRIRTMAGHDSVAMNRIAPTVMLFIPSVDGVSHCEREFSRDEDMVTGVEFLTEVAWRLVHGALQETK